MADIKFAKDYGFSPAAPFWIVWRESGHYSMSKHPNRESAETEAARIASTRIGEDIHVLCCTSTITTSVDVIGQRFDPRRAPPVAMMDAPTVSEPEFVDVEAVPTLVGSDADQDDEPF